MSISQGYKLAHTVHGKLSREADRPSSRLRVMVGHANLLDNLIAELSQIEIREDYRYNCSPSTTPRGELERENDDSSDSDQDSDRYSSDGDSDADVEADDDEDVEGLGWDCCYPEHAQWPCPSAACQRQPPELGEDSGSEDRDSDDEGPLSPGPDAPERYAGKSAFPDNPRATESTGRPDRAINVCF